MIVKDLRPISILVTVAAMVAGASTAGMASLSKRGVDGQVGTCQLRWAIALVSSLSTRSPHAAILALLLLSLHGSAAAHQLSQADNPGLGQRVSNALGVDGMPDFAVSMGPDDAGVERVATLFFSSRACHPYGNQLSNCIIVVRFGDTVSRIDPVEPGNFPVLSEGPSSVANFCADGSTIVVDYALGNRVTPRRLTSRIEHSIFLGDFIRLNADRRLTTLPLGAIPPILPCEQVLAGATLTTIDTGPIVD